MPKPLLSRRDVDAVTPSAVCPQSYDAFCGAAATVCEAVDAVAAASSNGARSLASGTRAFVGVRPPGHHCLPVSLPTGVQNTVDIFREYPLMVTPCYLVNVLILVLNRRDLPVWDSSTTSFSVRSTVRLPSTPKIQCAHRLHSSAIQKHHYKNIVILDIDLHHGKFIPGRSCDIP